MVIKRTLEFEVPADMVDVVDKIPFNRFVITSIDTMYSSFDEDGKLLSGSIDLTFFACNERPKRTPTIGESPELANQFDKDWKEKQ